MAGPPTDWTSGERVFAPPAGTLDVDWLVPAVLDLVPGATPQQARVALAAAATGPARGEVEPGDQDEATARVRAAADRVVAEARRSFRA